MRTVTTHFKIDVPVDFCDVDVDNDNRLFLDASMIRNTMGCEPYRTHAVRLLDSFFHVVARAVMASVPERVEGRDLLRRFGEPQETRFGMSAAGFEGRGGADDVGAAIGDALETNLKALLGIGVLSRVEHLPIFVPGVGADITSDITTRVVFAALADFTRDVTHRPDFSELRRSVRTVDRQVWDPSALGWVAKPVDLPHVDGKPLLLVPRGWARANPLVSSSLYFGKSVLDFLQDERSVAMGNGVVIRPSKDSLRKDPRIRSGVDTNRIVTLRALTVDVDLLDKYEQHVRRRLLHEGYPLAS